MWAMLSAVSPSALVGLPTRPSSHPLVAIALRLGLALFLVLVNWALVVIERTGYTDSRDGVVSATDALYYTTVTLTTTGYGDITPVTTHARMVNTLAVTPMRFLFVVVLVGTTIHALTRRSREDFQLFRWRKRVNDHVVVCGYGTKGRNAVRALLLQGQPPEGIVVVETDPTVAAEANAAGLASVTGCSTRGSVLQAAKVDRARAVIIALRSDDTAILVTLRTRSLAPDVTIVATARDAANGELLRQSGATSVIVSAETAGRLLGLAAGTPATVATVEELLSFGEGLDLAVRPVTEQEVGPGPRTSGYRCSP
ncbi:MAG: NAD-binding protein [Kineosporiaceae bacterium]